MKSTRESQSLTRVSSVHLVDLPIVTDRRGSLSFAEYGDRLPFVPERYFVVFNVIRAVIFRQDPALANSKLTDFNYDARWFGLVNLYSLEQVISGAEDAGWRLRDFRLFVFCRITLRNKESPPNGNRNCSALKRN